MHVDRQTRHRVLFKAHVRNEETMDHVVRPQNQFHFAIHRHVHRSRYNIVFRRRVARVEADRALPTRRRVDQLRLSRAEFAIRTRIPEIPRKLHPGYLYLRSARFCRPKTFRGPDRAAHQIQPDKQDRRQYRPHNFQHVVAVHVARWRRRGAVTIPPSEISQRQLRSHEDNSHQQVRGGKVMVNARSRSGRSGRQPPCLGNKEVGADESDQPDDDENNEAHVARPPEYEFSALLTAAARTSLESERGPVNAASLPQLNASASALLHFLIFSPAKILSRPKIFTNVARPANLADTH